jgi:N2-citryl-N6-acetyl-N6-hydroxylysine synthase
MPEAATFVVADQPVRPKANADQIAERLSAQCFLNALLRGSTAWSWAPLPLPCRRADLLNTAVVMPLARADERLILPLRYRSASGRHQFALPALHLAGEVLTPIDFASLVGFVVNDPGLLPARPEAYRRAFLARVTQSQRNMADTIDWHAGTLPDAGLTPDFAAAEQALICGHAVHPAPRSRAPMSDADARRYAPEFGGHFALEWLAVEPGAVTLQAAEQFDLKRALELFHEQERPGLDRLPPGWLPLPAHPWQLRQLEQHDAVRDLVTEGRLQRLGPGPDDWRATSSLRAVHSPRALWMLKFSMNVRLTNSLRVLEPREMARGLQTAQIKLMPDWAEFRRRYPAFDVLAEPGFATLRDARGAPLAQSLAMLRENPFRNGGQDNCAVLATLTQDDARLSCSAARMVRALARRESLDLPAATLSWFNGFLDCVIEPLIIAQADYGLLFGAHQQNLVLGFNDYRPARAWFRDCQGTGFSQVAAERFGRHIPDLGERGENLLDSAMANRLFSYYLVINSTLGLIGALGTAGLTDEAGLLHALRTRLETLRAGPRRDKSCLDYLLDSEQLWAKGNFICAWQGHNETTMADPTEIYHPLINPLHQAACRTPA